MENTKYKIGMMFLYEGKHGTRFYKILNYSESSKNYTMQQSSIDKDCCFLKFKDNENSIFQSMTKEELDQLQKIL